MNAQPINEFEIKIKFDAEVYYFIFATFVSIFLVCSSFLDAISWLETVLSVFALGVLPFLLAGLVMIARLIIRIRMTHERGNQ